MSGCGLLRAAPRRGSPSDGNGRSSPRRGFQSLQRTGDLPTPGRAWKPGLRAPLKEPDSGPGPESCPPRAPGSAEASRRCGGRKMITCALPGAWGRLRECPERIVPIWLLQSCGRILLFIFHLLGACLWATLRLSVPQFPPL